MTHLRRRLEKLEEASHGKGRIISIRASDGHGSEQVATILASHGIVETPNDIVVVLKSLYEDENGNISPSDRPPVLLAVAQMH